MPCGPSVAEQRPTPDRIALRGIRAQGHHGVYAFERERGQMFRVDAVEITVHKPEADLGVPFDDVTVTIRRERR